MSTEKKPPELLAREERIFLGKAYYHINSLGNAVCDPGREAEDCAMDNRGVPIYRHQLNLKQMTMLHLREEQEKKKEKPPIIIPQGVLYGRRKSDQL